MPALRALTALFLFCSLLSAAGESIFPLTEVEAGQRAVGKTVFAGDKVEEFDVEILGVLRNIGPKQSLILGRISGGPLERTGVMQGMSGSPVYIGGRLVGAIAMAFPFSKEPIAGIRPIEDMLLVRKGGAPPPQRASVSPFELDLTKVLPRREPISAGGHTIVDIATPLSFSGFTQKTVQHFAPQLRALGLEPVQGVSGGAGLTTTPGDPGKLEPGAMISVHLITGDLSIGADGTVTHIDGNQIYAFGHRFLSVGSTDLPFSRSEVLTLLPNISTSFKISSPLEWMGAITADRNAAIAGEFGRRPRLVPLNISVRQFGAAGNLGSQLDYRMEMAMNPFLSPLLLQMAIFSTIDATEQLVGSSTFALKGAINLENQPAPIAIDTIYAGEFNVPLQAAMAAAGPLAYAMQAGFDDLQVESINLQIDAHESKRHVHVSQAWASRPRVKPGQEVELNLHLLADDGVETTEKIVYRVPVGAAPGPLHFTVADALTANVAELQMISQARPRNPAQVISALNRLRGNSKLYIRIWRPETAYAVQGKELPAPPASVSLILSKDQPSLGGVIPSPNSKIAELAVDVGGRMVTGVQNVQVWIEN